MKLADVRFIFGKVCKDYPKMSHCLSVNADIVSHKPFEKVAMKIFDGLEIN